MHLRLIAATLVLSWPIWAQEAPPIEEEKAAPLVADPARDLFDLATLYYNEGSQDPANYRLAAKKFDQFLRGHGKHPRALEAWYFLGLSYQKVGEKKGARTCFETIVNRGQSGDFLVGSALQLASQDYEAKEWAQAAKWFRILAREAKEKDVRHEALYRRFLCFNELGAEEKMVSSLRAVLREPDIKYAQSARRSLASLYQKQGKLRQAFSLYAKLAESSEAEVSADATLQAALIAQKVGDKKQAPLWFSAAYKHPGLKEWRGQTQLTLMNFAYQQKLWQKVIQFYEDGEFSLKPEAALQRHILAAKSYDTLGSQKKALRVYEKIDRLSPNSESGFEAAYRVLIKAYEENKQNFTKKAESFLRKYEASHRSDPKVHSTRLLLAESYYKRKKYQRALARYRGLNFALIEASNRLGVRYHIAHCLIQLEDHPAALKAINDFVTHYPRAEQTPKLRLQRAEILTGLDRGSEALSDYQALLKTKDPSIKSLVLQRLAITYKEKEDYQKFAQTQREILTLPDLSSSMKASAKFWLGWNDYRLKNFDTAVPLLKAARDLAPKDYAKQTGPMLIRSAYQRESLEELEQEIKLLRRHDRKAKIPSGIQLWLGATLAKKKEYKRAFPLLHDGIQPESKALMWRLYGESALAIGRNKHALRAAETLLKKDSHPYRQAEAHYWKSQALTKMRQFNEARDSASAALDLRPSGELDLQLRLHAGDIEMAAKTPAKALRHYLVVESLYAKTPEDLARAKEKVIACLKAIGTPDALEKLKTYRTLESGN